VSQIHSILLMLFTCVHLFVWGAGLKIIKDIWFYLGSILVPGL